MMVGCGKSADDKKESDNSGVTTYTVGTEGAYPPFNLVNEKGEPDGYDIAVMKAIDDLNPNMKQQAGMESLQLSSLARLM